MFVGCAAYIGRIKAQRKEHEGRILHMKDYVKLIAVICLLSLITLTLGACQSEKIDPTDTDFTTTEIETDEGSDTEATTELSVVEESSQIESSPSDSVVETRSPVWDIEDTTATETELPTESVSDTESASDTDMDPESHTETVWHSETETLADTTTDTERISETESETEITIATETESETEAPSITEPDSETVANTSPTEEETQARPNGPFFRLSSVSNVACGDTVDIVVSIENNPGICSFMVSIDYDSSVLSLERVSACGDAGGQFAYGVYAAWLSFTDSYYNGAFFMLTFKVLDTPDSGKTSVSLHYGEDKICNVNEDFIYFDVLPGYVTMA